MQNVLVAGGGKIGALIAILLATSEDYKVHLVDIKPKSNDFFLPDMATLIQSTLDATDQAALSNYLKTHQITTLVSCLPYYCNLQLAQVAKQLSVHYFDLTEDIETGKQVNLLAKESASVFVPQCGLAPGFISIVANDLMQRFDQLENVLLRVGALPAYSHNALKYALTWSTDGLINEYGNIGYGLVNGKQIQLLPLEDLESVSIDGLIYEAFNTSGGLGTLASTYRDKVNVMNYKTLRYPGHCEKIRFLMNELKLNEDRQTFKKILEKALPRTKEDVVIIYVAVNGMQNGEFIEEVYVKKIYPKLIGEKNWSAIQVATASSACAVMDIVLKETQRQGLVTQESIPLEQFLQNRFGKNYQ